MRTMPKLSPCSEGAHSTSARASSACLRSLGDLPERAHAAVVEHHVGDLLGARAHQRQRGGDLVAQCLEGAQQHRQALALDGLADEQDPQGRLPVGPRHRSRPLALRDVPGRADDGRRPALLQLHAVGDDAAAPAVEAPRRPRRRLGDGDAHVQAASSAACRPGGRRRCRS